MRSKCFAHSYFKAWLSVFFPNQGTAKTRLPLTEILNKWQSYKDNGEVEENETKLSEGRIKQE